MDCDRPRRHGRRSASALFNGDFFVDQPRLATICDVDGQHCGMLCHWLLVSLVPPSRNHIDMVDRGYAGRIARRTHHFQLFCARSRRPLEPKKLRCLFATRLSTPLPWTCSSRRWSQIGRTVHDHRNQCRLRLTLKSTLKRLRRRVVKDMQSKTCVDEVA